MKYANLCLRMCVKKTRGAKCQFQKLANKRHNLLLLDVEPLQLTFVALGNNTGEPQKQKRKKKNSHNEIVDISVYSQGSKLALEMAED